MNAVFTICAKNYLAKARTLGDSLREIHSDVSFFIFIADEIDGYINPTKEIFRLIEAKELGIPGMQEMAFKYDVVEFCCAIKPFCFDYLFQRQYEKVIYFDPDIFIYSNLDSIYQLLDENFMVLTPHVTALSEAVERAIVENEFIYVGSFNLGFIALKSSSETILFLHWWQVRLLNYGFADRQDAQHVDQKWIDLVPSLFEKGVHISRNMGHNVAFWNFSERPLTVVENVYYVGDQRLVFFHFASQLSKRAYAQVQMRSYKSIFDAYESYLTKNGRDGCAYFPYKYANYNNGVSIFSFQRRLYRKLLEIRPILTDPFSTAPGSFYELLRINRLIITDTKKSSYIRKDFAHSGRIIHMYERGMNLLKSIIGIRYFHLLSRLLRNTSRPEDQLYLIRKGLAELK